MRFVVRVLVLSLVWLCVACGDNVGPVAPVPERPQYVRVSDYPTADSALRVVEVYGGTLDMEGKPATVAFQVRSSPLLIAQSRFVTITNCGGGLTPVAGQPVLRAAPGVSVYFFRLSQCLVLGPIDFSRFYNSTIEDVWMPTGGLTMTGAAFYNRFLNLYAGGPCLTATASGGISSGSNHNLILGGRCQGTVVIGPYVQDWTVEGMAFETCTGSCLKIAGTRINVGFNRWECNSPVGIELLAGSDGWIAPSYWSSCGIRIQFNGADPSSWVVAAQPGQQ